MNFIYMSFVFIHTNFSHYILWIRLQDTSTPEFSTLNFNPRISNPEFLNRELWNYELLNHEFLNWELLNHGTFKSSYLWLENNCFKYSRVKISCSKSLGLRSPDWSVGLKSPWFKCLATFESASKVSILPMISYLRRQTSHLFQ